MENITFIIVQSGSRKFGSNRHEATPIHLELREFLSHNEHVVLDFVNITSATQSWVDEVLGKFFLEEGRAFLNRIKFKNCTPLIQSILKLVITDRVSGHENYKNNEYLPQANSEVDTSRFQHA